MIKQNPEKSILLLDGRPAAHRRRAQASNEL
jgi:hypothetical protein